MLSSLSFLAISLAGLAYPALAVTGDTQCQRDMCITAIAHNNATTSYDLTVANTSMQWVALGFGPSMVAAPLVILWKDTTTGETVVSQRETSDFVMPTVVSNPSPLATGLSYRAASNSTALTMSFTVPSTTETRQRVIWAWSVVPPSDNTPNATIAEHNDEGLVTLNMANPLPDSLDGPTSTGSAPTTTAVPTASYGGDNIALTPSQKVFAAHAVFLTLAFIVILPLGALQARLLRTFVPGKFWFGAHWILQWPVTTVLIVVGFALGVSEVNKIKTGQLNSTHKKWGLVLVLLYIVQCSLGGFIHFIKSSKSTRRPPQNYTHAVLGLLIIALSFWQVYTGLDTEWGRVGGPDIPKSIWIWWKVWTVMIPTLYVCGLALLPRQYKMERQQRATRQMPIKISAPKLQDDYFRTAA